MNLLCEGGDDSLLGGCLGLEGGDLLLKLDDDFLLLGHSGQHVEDEIDFLLH